MKTWKARRWSVTLLAATLLAAVAMLCSRGRGDNENRFQRASSCADANTGGGYLSSMECLEGHPCVFCAGDSAIGEIVGGGDGGKRHMPVQTACGGTRLIGSCIGNGGVSNCDLSNYWVDGTCGGHVTNYSPQPISGVDPPGSGD